MTEKDPIQGIAPAEEIQEGFTVQPTGMMEQVLVGVADDKTPLLSEPQRAHLEWLEANPGMESQEMVEDREMEYERLKALEDAVGAEVKKNPIAPTESMDAKVNVVDSVDIGEPVLEKKVSTVSIGRIVTYRSRTGNYDVPAIVNCTSDSIYQPGVEHGFVPPISAVDNVHLTVLTPGRPGMRATAGEGAGEENFVVKSAYPVSENVSGCYQEWDIPYDAEGGPGTWRWPSRV